MMDKPTRHKNHVLETESRKFYENQVPNEWFSDKPEHDYGIDFNTNIVINDQVTGLNFSVQIKSHETESNPNYSIIVLNLSTLRLFNTRLEPILLVSYVRSESEAYWAWYNDLSINLLSSNKTTTVNIPKSNKLSVINWNKVISYVQNIFSIKLLIDGIKSLEYSNLTAHEITAWKYYFSQDFEDAAYYFKNALKSDPDNSRLLEGLSNSQYESFHYSEALNNINKAINISPNPEYQLSKACILAEDGIRNHSRGKVLEASVIFKKFLDKFPAKAMYHYNYANTLAYLNENEESIRYYKISLQISPNYAEAWKNLGSVYNKIHEHEKEMVCYDNALRIKPDLIEALFSKGITLSSVYNNHVEAKELMLSAFHNKCYLNIVKPHSFYWLAFVHEKLNEVEETLTYLNRGLELDPEDVYLLNMKSNVLAKVWKNNENLKNEALDFFHYRLGLDGHFKSLYFLIQIKNIREDEELIVLFKRHTAILSLSSIDTLKSCEIKLKDCVDLLIHYEKYLEIRHSHPLSRYSDQLISPFYSITSSFMETLDLIFATAFSKALHAFSNFNDPGVIEQMLLNELLLIPNLINQLIPEKEYSKEEAIEVLSSVFLNLPLVAIREFGLQIGTINGKLGLDKPKNMENLYEDWRGQLNELILNRLNDKLKIFSD